MSVGRWRTCLPQAGEENVKPHHAYAACQSANGQWAFVEVILWQNILENLGVESRFFGMETARCKYNLSNRKCKVCVTRSIVYFHISITVHFTFVYHLNIAYIHHSGGQRQTKMLMRPISILFSYVVLSVQYRCWQVGPNSRMTCIVQMFPPSKWNR